MLYFAILTEFLAMLNPFALFLYLEPVMQELSNKDFIKVLFKATVISLMVLIFFFIVGNVIFNKIFYINFDSFRIFGGIVIFSFAYFFIVRGDKAAIYIKEDLDDLASEIALPFMVGAGTISLAILLRKKLNFYEGLIMLLIIMFSNFFIILFLKFLKDSIKKPKFKVAFDKNMAILIRLNGFFIGAIGVDMIVEGIQNFFAIG